MFSALENTGDDSARRRWTTLVSFTMQALGLSLLLAVPLLTVQGPPRLHWISSPFFSPPPAPLPPSSGTHRSTIHSSNMRGNQIVAPPSIPDSIADVRETGEPVAPSLGDLVVPGGTGLARPGVPGGFGDTIAIAPPQPPPPTRPLPVSHWAEGNLIYRVQPVYPQLARHARVQGTVRLRAVISRTGTIENLTILSGHPMLATAAVEAVRQWRYRPYLLNSQPIAVETEVTVNFVLSGS